MLINEIIEKAKTQKVHVFFDMDGIMCMIAKAKILSDNGVNVYIMSNCHFEEQKQDKIKWLKKHAPFINPENIYINVFNNEVCDKDTKHFIKVDKIQAILGDEEFILIEDNPSIIKATNKVCPNSAHHLSELLD